MIQENFIKGYITGFFDGEGCIHIDKCYDLNIIIESADYSCLLLFLNEFNFSVYKKICEIYKVSWHCTLNVNDNLSFLNLIEPHSIVKKDQIRLAIEYQKLMTVTRNCKKGLSESEVKMREYYRQKLMELKKRLEESIENGDDNTDVIMCITKNQLLLSDF